MCYAIVTLYWRDWQSLEMNECVGDKLNDYPSALLFSIHFMFSCFIF